MPRKGGKMVIYESQILRLTLYEYENSVSVDYSAARRVGLDSEIKL